MKGRGEVDRSPGALLCSSCGQLWASEAAFCGVCGAKLVLPSGAPAAVPPSAASATGSPPPGRRRLLTPLPFLPATIPANGPTQAEGSGLLPRPVAPPAGSRDFSRTVVDAAPPVMPERSDPGASGSQRTTVEILAQGARLGEFKVEAFLGMGAMGTVYGATHTVIGRRVAIKVLRRDLVDNAEAVGRFVREAQAACRVRHPNVIDVYTFGVLPDGCAYFAMEWLEGETLRQRLGRPLVLGEVVGIADQVIAALGALHAHQVVHRDLKPDNVHLTPAGVKLLDFGVAKLLDVGSARDRLTKAGFVVGTAEYASPEQAGGHAVDERTDVYSLGVMLFELLTGRRPFNGASPVDLLVEHIASPAPRATLHRPTLPADLDALVFGMMAKTPAARPTLLEVHERLVAWQHSRMPVGVITRAAPDSRTVVDGSAMRLPLEPPPHATPPIGVGASAPAAAPAPATTTPAPMPAPILVPTALPLEAVPGETTDPVRFAQPWRPERPRGLGWKLVAIAMLVVAIVTAITFFALR